jgi:DNA polymerase III subunit alpha
MAMPYADFVHLRVHTAYSLLEGAIRIEELADLCKAQRMPAVAMTDTNNLFGALEFSGTCAKNGIQPIIGCQLGITRVNGPERGPPADPDGLVLLVQNEAGYANLLKLVAEAFLEGEANEPPQVAIESLEAHADGLIALTGGPAGPVGRLLVEGRTDVAETLLLRLAAAFSGRLYVELMRHGLENERRIEPELLDLAYRHQLPLVATNEAFFDFSDMYEAHDALVCISDGAYVSQDERRRLTPNHRFKTAAEMRTLFADLPEAVDNTVVVARRCAFMVEGREPLLPSVPRAADGRDEAQVLADLAREGLGKRLRGRGFMPGAEDAEREKAARKYGERLEYELGVIVEMGFPGYFLIVADFIHWAKEQGIPVGPGRGSGAGSVVAWALTVTDLDPLRFGLLFERFLNPERVSMPDFDIDFCQDRRDEVIRYVQEKYGRDRVAQIITFGKLQARAVLRDVGRVLEMPYSKVDRICKMVPNNPTNPLTLDQAIAAEAQLRAMVNDDPEVTRLMGMARKLEGLYRHASTHAAGVVIGDRPLDQLIPLYRDPRSDMPVTGFNMKFVEKAGLVKFDFLGLKTLTVLATAVDLMAKRDVEVDLSHLPLDDTGTFDMLARAETVGVFQLESAGMQDVLRKLRPDTFEEIIAVVALYRPGPMDNIPSYIKRKHGEEKPDYLYPTLEGILKETFGIMIYQEQVMQIAQELSGFSLGGADVLRRAMGKKDQEEMDRQRQSFVDGAVARSVPKAKALDIFEQVDKFAGYGFNKSHAAAYALVAYQTAWFKANHPVEFLAASMTLDMGNTDKLNVFRQELERLGIPLLQPDINASGVAFTVEYDAEGGAAIRYALAAIKNVGEGAMAALIAEREANGPFKDPFEFAGRLDSRVVNKRQLENLVRAGAFDCLCANRQQVFKGVEAMLRHASAAAEERNSGQIGLFGESSMAAPVSLADTPDWPDMEKLKEEADAVGFYLSGHPLDDYAKSLERLRVRRYTEVLAAGRSEPVKLAGTVIDRKERTSSKGNRFGFVRLSDTSGTFEITVFSEILANSRDLLEPGNSLVIDAKAQFEGETVRFTADAIKSLDGAAAAAGTEVRVHLDSAEGLSAFQGMLSKTDRGRGRVTAIVRMDAATEVVIDVADKCAVPPAMVRALEELPGISRVEEV